MFAEGARTKLKNTILVVGSTSSRARVPPSIAVANTSPNLLCVLVESTVGLVVTATHQTTVYDIPGSYDLQTTCGFGAFRQRSSPVLHGHNIGFEVLKQLRRLIGDIVDVVKASRLLDGTLRPFHIFGTSINRFLFPGVTRRNRSGRVLRFSANRLHRGAHLMLEKFTLITIKHSSHPSTYMQHIQCPCLIFIPDPHIVWVRKNTTHIYISLKCRKQGRHVSSCQRFSYDRHDDTRWQIKCVGTGDNERDKDKNIKHKMEKNMKRSRVMISCKACDRQDHHLPVR